jgi:excisionase family DNA binding protein
MNESEVSFYWFTVTEAARYLRVSRRTIYSLCAERALVGYRAGEGKHRRFKKEDLDKLLKKEKAENDLEQIYALTSKNDPVLAEVWENEMDSAYDQL